MLHLITALYAFVNVFDYKMQIKLMLLLHQKNDSVKYYYKSEA